MRFATWLTLLASLAGLAGPVVAAEIRDVRIAPTDDGTRVVLELSGPVKHKAFLLDKPGRVVVDLARSSLKTALPEAAGSVIALRSGPLPHEGLRLVFEVSGAVSIQTSTLAASKDGADRLVLDILAPGAVRTVATAPAARRWRSAPRTRPPKAGATSSSRWTPGHGGVDPGASGARGTHEKDVVLEIARALAARINQEPGLKAVLTRDGDYFISLRERNLRARRAKADLFVSIHADSIANPDVSGSSVYVLSERGASSEAARWLAERENAADLKGGIKLDDKDPVLQGVLLDLSQTASISSSMTAAEQVLQSLDHIGRGAQAARAAGGLRGAQVSGHSIDAGRDRVHLEPRRRTQAVAAGASRAAGQRYLCRHPTLLRGQRARRHAPGDHAARRRHRPAGRTALEIPDGSMCARGGALHCAASPPCRSASSTITSSTRSRPAR